MNFLRCLSASISDFVSRLETNEIQGFIGSEGTGVDVEQFGDFIRVSPLKFANDGFVWRKVDDQVLLYSYYGGYGLCKPGNIGKCLMFWVMTGRSLRCALAAIIASAIPTP